MDKRALRQKYKAVRDSIPENLRKEKSRIIQEKILSLDSYKKCRELFTYYSFGSETETEALIENAMNGDKTVALPYMTKNKGEMVFVRISSLSELVKNSFGIYEPVPSPENIVIPTEKTVIIVPGAVFSRDRYRIGYGGGYYDRYLSRYKTLSNIGICFSEQIVDNIPANEYDIRLDELIFA